MTATGRPPRMAMCIEQTLGHRTHGINLERAFRARGAAIDVFRVEFPERGRLPVPWALRSSANAYRQLRRAERYDVTLFHTQTIALLAPHAVRGSRYVVSLDATPLQVDEMSSSYDHSTHPRAIEAAKRRWYRWVFQRAAGVISWSRWAAQSAIEQYGADPSTLLVAHRGRPRASSTCRARGRPIARASSSSVATSSARAAHRCCGPSNACRTAPTCCW